MDYFNLYSQVVITRGVSRALLADCHRHTYKLVTLLLADILEQCRNSSLSQISRNNLQPETVLRQYLQTLEQEQWGFFSYQPVPTPGTPDWDWPSQVTNIAIEVSEKNIDLLLVQRHVFDDCSKLHCKHAHVLCDETIDALKFTALYSGLSKCGFETLEWWISCSLFNELPDFFRNTFATVFVYPTPGNRIKHPPSSSVTFVREHISSRHCGYINPDYFSFNAELYTESLYHNTCLNRKMAIDAEGNIKNCPSMSRSYGNIRDTTLSEALEQPGFKELWQVHKGLISVCKDCEFRHICTDCRAYVENPEDGYSKPLKCGYNPRTCEWEPWSAHPLKQKAIEYYGLQELVKKP